MVRVIREEDFVASVADALQFISVYHPADYIHHLAQTYEREESPAARHAIAQILANSRMSAIARRPICQDTGTVIAFVKLGMDARIDSRRPLAELVDEGVRRAYRDPDNPLRASMVADPIFERRNKAHRPASAIPSKAVRRPRRRLGDGRLDCGTSKARSPA